MARAHLEAMLNFLVVLYLVTHGVSVPPDRQGDLLSGFCLSVRAWIGGNLDRLTAFVGLASPLVRA